MKKILFLFLFLFGMQAQVRYLDTLFTSYTVDSNIVYGTDTTFAGTVIPLTMDIYTPDGDVITERPAIVFVHGGTFVTGSKNDSEVVALCKAFVHRGYVTVSINYRIGFNFSSDPAILQAEAIKALLRGVQDGKGAFRYLYKTAKNMGNLYKIDTTNLFFAGVSAGAFIGNHIAYMQTIAELNQYTSDTLLNQIGGGLDGRNNPGYSYNFKAMVNLCGAVGLSSWIDATEIPLISMHGTADQTVPYGQGSVLGVLAVHGSYSMDSVADLRGVPSALFTWDSLGHVPFEGTNPENIYYMNQTIDWVSKNLYSLMQQNTLLPDTSVQPYMPASLQFVTLPGSEISFFPNPTKDNLTISVLNPSLKRLNVEIYNIEGKKMLNKTFIRPSEKLNLNISTLEQGTYLLRFSDNEGRQRTEKLIVR